MSTPSLASEIAQLHELFKLGALTEEEFNSAKQATIRSFTAKAAPSPAAPLPTTDTPASTSSNNNNDSNTQAVSSAPAPPELTPLVSSTEDKKALPVKSARSTPARSREEWQRLWDESNIHLPSAASPSFASATDGVDVRVQALRCADRLFRNLQAHPDQQKYRQIREANAVIARELLSVEASAALLTFAGFTRESIAAADGAETHVWVQHDDVSEAARKASAATRLVGHLLDYMGAQQSRRYGVQQLWQSVALEVRLERAAREASVDDFPNVLDSLIDVGDDGASPDQHADDAEEDKNEEDSTPHTVQPSPHRFLTYLVECYTVDEAGDGLYSSLQHLKTLEELYAAQHAPSRVSLIRTAEVYGAVVQQRGAVELLCHGCRARLHPPPAAAAAAAGSQRASNASATATPAAAADTASMNDYFVELVPSDVNDAAAHRARCVRLLRWVLAQVETVQRRRATAARDAAEKSMRQELKRERQRQQLEQSRVRTDVEAENSSPPRRARLQGSRQRRSSSSSSSTESSEVHSASAPHEKGNQQRRIPIAEALAILMGKKSPPQRRPPAASSSPQ